MAVFYVAASLAGAFSGLLAYGIEKLDGRSGLAGWQVRSNSNPLPSQEKKRLFS